eukprot:8040642-Pyramimonas_sp.AAC.1
MDDGEPPTFPASQPAEVDRARALSMANEGQGKGPPSDAPPGEASRRFPVPGSIEALSASLCNQLTQH